MGKNHEELWDVEENVGFGTIKSKVDNLEYKVYSYGNENVEQKIADILGTSRRNINFLLFYLIQNQQLWINNNIAWGIIHTFDIHIPCWRKHYEYILTHEISNKMSDFINNECLKNGNLYRMQEMTPNDLGLIGLNKPKKTIKLKDFDYYEIASVRSMHLTLRDKRTNEIKSEKYIMDLVIHELTHTTCNDIHWKENNHSHPYPVYHKMMRKWAKDIHVLPE